MKKVIIKDIDNYVYTLIDETKNVYNKNIEFYSDYKPMVGDIIYLSENILYIDNLYAFDDSIDAFNNSIDDIIKIIHDDKEYYFQRKYG